MTSFKINNNTILGITGLLIICLILTLNFNAFYWADDYAVFNEINEYGVIERCLNGYYTWDGRYLTPAAFLQGFFLEILPVELITFFWNSCFLLSGILLYFIIKKETNDKFTSHDKIYFPFLIAVLFWLGSYRHIAQTIYWATGGVYSFNLFLGAVWLFLYYKIQNNTVNNTVIGYKIGFLLTTVFVGLTTQNLTIGLITLLSLVILSDFLKNEKTNIKFNILLLLIIIGGTLFLSLAPGNFIRAKEVNDTTLGNITLWIIIRNYAFGLITYLLLSFFLIILSFAAGFVYAKQNGYKISTAVRDIIFIPKTKEQLISFIDIYKYLIVALSTILPFITMPEMLSPRTAIFFMFFIVLFIFKFISQLTVTQLNSNENKISSVIIYTLFFAAFCFIAYNFQKGITLKSEITKREVLLQNSKNKVVRIRKIDEHLKSYCYDFRDFRNDSDWAVEAQEEYFSCSKIVVEN